MGRWIRIVAVIKKNIKVKFKNQAQTALAPGMLTQDPSNFLLPTTHIQLLVQRTDPAPPLKFAGQELLVWPPDFWGQNRKSVNTLKSLIYQQKEWGWDQVPSPLMWYVNFKVQFLLKMTKINLTTNPKHIFLSISALSTYSLWEVNYFKRAF